VCVYVFRRRWCKHRHRSGRRRSPCSYFLFFFTQPSGCFPFVRQPVVSQRQCLDCSSLSLWQQNSQREVAGIFLWGTPWWANATNVINLLFRLSKQWTPWEFLSSWNTGAYDSSGIFLIGGNTELAASTFLCNWTKPSTIFGSGTREIDALNTGPLAPWTPTMRNATEPLSPAWQRWLSK